MDFCKIRVICNSSFSYLVPNIKQEHSLLKGNIFNELISRGNFISNQAMLIKKNFILKYLFDPQMTRLQDYDLILRMIPKVKISYTNLVLVDLHLQNDSITRSSKKLVQSVYILLNKTFVFNSLQKKLFSNYLTSLLKAHNRMKRKFI